MRDLPSFLWRVGLLALTVGAPGPGQTQIMADLTSSYHRIQVVDEDGFRILSFDGSMESRISLTNPLLGHFKYTEYFHLAWLWNTQLTRILIVGLGGASTQRAFEHYYPDLTVETAELDPMVVAVARQYFQFRESDRQKVHVADGRMFLRRTREQYDLIVMDAYSRHRYGSFVPHHLVTQEFFALAKERLKTNGVLCYNIMGSWQGWNAGLVAAVYKTLNTAFPQVYVFPVPGSLNVVLLASKSPRKLAFPELDQRASALIRQKRITLPGFRDHLYTIRTSAPHAVSNAPVLTDDFTPLESLIESDTLGEQEVNQRTP
jgi:spermidine synthase